MMMGAKMNYNVCEIVLENKNTIWMHISFKEEDVTKIADELINNIRLKYDGHLNIS